MSQYTSFFTLNIVPNDQNPLVVDLLDPQGVLHYRKQKEPGTVYTVNVYGASHYHVFIPSFLGVYCGIIDRVSRSGMR